MNYYLDGKYYDGMAYQEDVESSNKMREAVREIVEAEKEYVKMGKPKSLAHSVVQTDGLILSKTKSCPG